MFRQMLASLLFLTPCVHAADSFIGREILPFLQAANNGVLAIGAWKEAAGGKSVAGRISHAWRFNLDGGRIEPIAVKGVACAFEHID